MRARTLACVCAAAAVAALLLTTTAAAHDHPAPAFTAQAPLSTAVNAGGPGAKWRLITTIATGNPLTDLDFFTRNGETYMSVGTLAIGPNAGGQTIVRLTQNGQPTASPQVVGNHPSAACVSDPAAALGLQHDAEATPKGNVIFGAPNPYAVRTDAQLVIDATDNEGRCHDGGSGAGLAGSDPQGGLEIIDVTNPAKPVEIGLVANIGEAHTVNVDPKRPHIAFAVTSDAVNVTCNADDSACFRQNEDPASGERFDLDGFEVVDLSSCMNFPVLTPVDLKRQTCRPQVYRYRYPSALNALGHTIDHVGGCHELEIYPDDRLACASISATMLFDLSGAFDDNGTPTNYADDRPRGTPLPCRVRASSSIGPYMTGAKITDCVFDPTGGDLMIPRWIQLGSPSLEGVKFLGSAFHQGRPPNGTLPPQPATEDIEVSHEAELTESGRFLFATDERGGGVLPGQGSCLTSPADNIHGNGGIHAYRPDRLLRTSPNDPAVAFQSYARTPSGAKAIYRAPIRTQPQTNICTAHVFHIIPGQNRIFMGWYSQGTQVVDFVEHPNGTIEFREAAFFIPENANTWVSAIFKMRENADGTFTYWGATGDFYLGGAGRNAIDVYEVTLPAPPKPLAGPTTAKATGGGWLLDPAARKINFAFKVENRSSGPTGSLQLSDSAAGASVELTRVTSVGIVSAPCRSIADGPKALEIRGQGTFNGAPAGFRACVADGGEGSGAAADRFYLECTSGCAYSTGSRTADDDVDGGNVQVRRSGEASASGASQPTTVTLQPVNGQSTPLTATVYDGNGDAMSGVEIAITRTTATGTETLTALTGASGTASISVAGLHAAEYVASAGGVQSNAVELAGLLG